MRSYVSKVDTNDWVRKVAATWEEDIMAKRRDPHSRPPQVSTRSLPIPSDKINRQLQSRLANGKENPVRVSSGGQDEFPIVCPVRIDVHRVMGVFEHDLAGDSEGLMGHIIDLDFYTKQSHVKINMYRDPNALTIEVNGEEIYQWVEDDSTIPVKLPEFLDRHRQEMGAWIDQVNLQPGDEVIEVDGEIVINRADDPIIDDEDIFGPNGDEAMDELDPIIEDDDDIIFE